MEDLVEMLEKETQIPTADTAFTQPQKLPFTVILDKPAGDGDDFNTRFFNHDLAVEFYAERIDKANEKNWKTFRTQELEMDTRKNVASRRKVLRNNLSNIIHRKGVKNERIERKGHNGKRRSIH